MRKSRFLINLIATTAIGLSVVGCGGSSSEGAIRDTSDISIPNSNGPNRNLREYLLIGQRGLEIPVAKWGTGASLPTAPTGREAGVSPKDAVGIEGGLMYELLGIASVPTPDLQFVAPGGASLTPQATEPVVNITGFHQMYPSPSGKYIIGMSRAKDNLPGVDGSVRARVQVFHIDVPPTDVVFPPEPSFGGPATAGASIFDFSPDQGEFVSGAWSRSGTYFYFSLNEKIYKSSFSDNIGALSISLTGGASFPAGTGTAANNAVQLLASQDGGFLFALDNLNGTIITYSIDAATGDLTEVNTLATVADPRGFALDRTGNFLYVAGRSSQQLAGYRVVAGALTAIELFPAAGIGAIPFTYGEPLGDVATSPASNQLFLGAYSGTVSGFVIDQTTGALVDGRVPEGPLGGARNLANLEVEPSGRFLITAFEHDFDTFQNFVTPANGFGIDESDVFANTNSLTNTALLTVASPQLDSNGRVAYLFPTTLGGAFTGSVQSNRIGADANVTVENAISVENPYGLAFFQLVFTPPASTETLVP